MAKSFRPRDCRNTFPKRLCSKRRMHIQRIADINAHRMGSRHGNEPRIQVQSSSSSSQPASKRRRRRKCARAQRCTSSTIHMSVHTQTHNKWLVNDGTYVCQYSLHSIVYMARTFQLLLHFVHITSNIITPSSSSTCVFVCITNMCITLREFSLLTAVCPCV